MPEDNATHQTESLPLIYEELKGNAIKQITLGALIEGKAFALFFLCTAVGGAGVPFVVGQFTHLPIAERPYVIAIAAIAACLYLLGFGILVWLIWPRGYEDIIDTDEFQKVIDSSKQEMLEALYSNAEEAYKNNRSINEAKAQKMKIILLILVPQLFLSLSLILLVAYWATKPIIDC